MLTKKQFKTLEKVFNLSQENLRLSLQKVLINRYGNDNVFATKTFIYAEGDIPVCLVAHMDTVHKQPPGTIYYDEKQDIMWSPFGLGADDRAGVFSILQIIKDGYRPHVVFTTDEEIGCLGAKALVKARKKIPFKECNFLIELDRRGTDDCVFYDLDNEDFEKFIESYGFKTDFGSYSDICDISPAWGCAAVNLSIGYFNEHTQVEMLSPYYMFQTIARVESILKDAKDGKTQYYKYIPLPYNRYFAKYYDYGYDYYDDCECYKYGSSKENNKTERGICYWCLKEFSADDLIPVTTPDGYIDYYCPECYKKRNELAGGRKDV